MRSLVVASTLLVMVLAGLSDAGERGLVTERRPTGVLGRAFLKSPQGREFLRQSTHPKAAEWLQLYHGETRAASVPGAPAPATPTEPAPQDPGTVSSNCGTVAGTRFNLEAAPNALPQFPQAIDFFRNGVASGVDLVVGLFADIRFLNGSFETYAVSRDADCAPEFEGGLPDIDDPLEAATTVSSVGGGAVAVDPARNAVFAASVYEDGTTSGIGLLRTTRTTLLSAVACPAGTHAPAAAATCWPTRRFVGQLAPSVGSVERPHIAVDEKTSGTGAGTVYIAYPRDEQTPPFRRRIFLQACTNSLAICTPPQLVSGSATFAEIPHVAVRPVAGAIAPGHVTLTWLDTSGFPAVLRYRSCTPVTPPTAPTCGSISTVGVQEFFSNFFLTTGGIITGSFPQHDHRQEGSTIETYVVWTRCHPVSTDACPETDIVMKASNNNGATWSALRCVDCNAQDQFSPSVRTDRTRGIVNIAYHSSQGDPTFQHRTQVMLVHIDPGAALPDPPERRVLTTLLNDLTTGGGFLGLIFGGTIETAVAARSLGPDGTSRAYVHHMSNHLQGDYSGIPAPDANNHVSRFDY
jgi:hypothetical protein